MTEKACVCEKNEMDIYYFCVCSVIVCAQFFVYFRVSLGSQKTKGLYHFFLRKNMFLLIESLRVV